MTEIRVNAAYLQNLASRIDDASSMLKSDTALDAAGVACTPEVQTAYQRFGARWDQRRSALAKNLEALSDGFRTAAKEFTETDAELKASISGEGCQ